MVTHGMSICIHGGEVWHAKITTPHIIGASLSEPNIDHDNSPRARNNFYLCITCMSINPCLSHPGSQDLCMPRAHVRGLQLHVLD